MTMAMKPSTHTPDVSRDSSDEERDEAIMTWRFWRCQTCGAFRLRRCPRRFNGVEHIGYVGYGIGFGNEA